ncbi:MAG TPA: hypothetical protein VJO52_16160 [Gemmatimonadaceae bacterium]|nr:hypothetical protein [Gemmatimonadaceae bacterium]
MRPLGLMCALALIAACSGSTSVRPFGGTYDLVSVNGKPDPQPVYVGSTTEVVSGALVVSSDTLNVTLELQPEAITGPGDIVSDVNAIPYVRRGDSLFIADSGSAGDGLGGLAPGARPIGRILGGNVQLSLAFTIASSTGFGNPPSRFLFTPAP